MPQSTAPQSLLANHLLAALPREGYERLLPALEPIMLVRGDVLYEPGQTMGYLYFPTTALVFLVYTMADGATVEIGLVGNEGVVEIPLFMGGDTTTNRAVVQVAGHAFRMKRKALQQEFQRGGSFQLALLRYTQALITQISQLAACNCLHPVEQRLCRWLLLTCDRASSDKLPMTQEFIAHLLGVRRQSITVAAHHFQAAGLIRYAHGHIIILNRQGLEAKACECYQKVKNGYERLLGQLPAT